LEQRHLEFSGNNDAKPDQLFGAGHAM
jgi:organic hydroperoxide reductase OsmC/OhrA